MANTIDWGQGAVNNTNGWGKSATNNTIDFGEICADSWSPETNLVGGSSWSNTQSILTDGVDDFVISNNEIHLNGTAAKSLFARFKFNDQPEGVQYVAGWGWDGEGPQPGNKNFSIASSPLNHPDLYSSNNNLMMWGVGAPNITDIQFNYFLNPGEWCDALITHDCIKKAYCTMGWRPQTDLDDGLRLCIDWYYRERAWLSRLNALMDF